MKRLAVVSLCLVLGIAGSSGIASAKPATHGLKYLLGLQGTPAPTEWAGVWTVQDSSYLFCGGAGSFTTSPNDTICAGQSFEQPDQPGVTCTGNADATTFHQHCTGTDTSDPDCTFSFDFVIDGTRTGTTYKIVSMINFTSSGTGEGCGLSGCQRYVSFGTYFGPAPVEYCTTTGVKRASWGQLKILYR